MDDKIYSSNDNHSQKFKVGQSYNCLQTQLNDPIFSVYNKKNIHVMFNINLHHV